MQDKKAFADILRRISKIQKTNGPNYVVLRDKWRVAGCFWPPSFNEIEWQVMLILSVAQIKHEKNAKKKALGLPFVPTLSWNCTGSCLFLKWIKTRVSCIKSSYWESFTYKQCSVGGPVLIVLLPDHEATKTWKRA